MLEFLGYVGLVWLIGTIVFYILIRIEAGKQNTEWKPIQLGVATIWWIWLPWYGWLLASEWWQNRNARVA